MGNAQSSHHRSRPHNRLAKPKTSSKTESQPGSLASRYAQLSAKDRQQIKSQLLSPLETEFENAAVDQDCKLHVVDDVPTPASPKMQRRLSNSSRTNSMSCFGSKRESSSRLNSIAGSKASLHDAIDVETAVRILEEVRRNASPEELAALQQALQPDPPSPSPRLSSTLDPGSSVRNSIVLNRSSSSLTRRRSLVATPGLATRNSPAEKNRRTWNSWRTPQLDAQEEAKWNSEKKLARLSGQSAVLDVAEEPNSPPAQRAVTPCDKEYTHLGTLQLGSLRIANGEPEPAPSRALGHLSGEDDYFTPPDVEDAPITMKVTKRHARSKSALLPPTPPLYRKLRLSTSIRKSKTMSRCDSPQKPENPTKLEPPPRAETVPPQFDDDEEPEPIRRLRVMNKSADTLANMVMQHQAKSAEEASSESHDVDEGFVSDEEQSPHAETYRILDGAIFGEPLTTIESTPYDSRSHLALDTQLPATNVIAYEEVLPTVELPELEARAARPPPTKADSGYSSVGSFALVQGHAMREESPPLLEEPSCEPASTAPQQTLSTQEHVRPASLLIPNNVSSTMTAHLAAIESPKSPVSILSTSSMDGKVSSSKRLQKRRPSQSDLPAVEPREFAPKSTIPEVPSDVKSKFATRMAEAPDMGCLTETYPSKDHVKPVESKDHATPVEVKEAPAAPRGRVHSRSVTEQPPTTPSRLRRSLSLFRSKPKTGKDKDKVAAFEEEPDDMSMFVDFGDVGAALGRSPYDAAIDAAFRHTVVSPTYPHQMGDVMPLPRAKSMVSMDAKTASDFARARSKVRSQAAAAAATRPQMPQRPKSYHYTIHEGSRSPPPSEPHGPGIPPVPTLHHSISSGNLSSNSNAPPPAQTSTPDPPSVRARPTGRGPVVSKIVNQYDQYGDWVPIKEEWRVNPRTPLQQQRRRNNTVGAQSRSGGPVPYEREQRRPQSAQPQRYHSQQQQQQQHHQQHFQQHHQQHQQHLYEFHNQQQQQQAPQQRPQPQRRAVSMYGRHSLPSQDPASAYNGNTAKRTSSFGHATAAAFAAYAPANGDSTGGGAPAPAPVVSSRAANTAVGTRQLHSYSYASRKSRTSARYYSG